MAIWQLVPITWREENILIQFLPQSLFHQIQNFAQFIREIDALSYMDKRVFSCTHP